MNNKNYQEPEFKLVKVNDDDIITASSRLAGAFTDWETRTFTPIFGQH